MTAPAQTILLAEDNEDDVFIFNRAYKQAGAPFPVNVVHDGQELTDYLLGAGRFGDRSAYPLPFLLLLDLKLPLRHGLEVLEWMRSRPELAGIIVVTLTSSAEQRDLASARALGARYYLVKPPRAQTLADLFAIFQSEREGTTPASTALEGNLFQTAAANNQRLPPPKPGI